MKDSKGQAGGSLGNLLGSLILLVIAVVVITDVVIPTVKNANTTGFTTAEVALWGLVSLACIVGALFLAFRAFGIF